MRHKKQTFRLISAALICIAMLLSLVTIAVQAAGEETVTTVAASSTTFIDETKGIRLCNAGFEKLGTEGVKLTSYDTNLLTSAAMTLEDGAIRDGHTGSYINMAVATVGTPSRLVVTFNNGNGFALGAGKFTADYKAAVVKNLTIDRCTQLYESISYNNGSVYNYDHSTDCETLVAKADAWVDLSTSWDTPADVESIQSYSIYLNSESNQYYDDVNIWFYPKNSFIEKKGGDLSLNIVSGSTYTFPTGTGVTAWGCDGKVYSAGQTVALSELSQKTVTALDAIDIDAVSVTYAFENDRVGSADGTLTVTTDEDLSLASLIELVWANGNDTKGYTALADHTPIKSADGASFPTSYTINKDLAIPEGATALMLRITDVAGTHEIVCKLPTGKIWAEDPIETVAFISDIHIGWAGLKLRDSQLAARDEINQLGVDKVMVVGDFVQWYGEHSMAKQWDLAEEYFKGFNMPVFIAKGNHDEPNYKTAYIIDKGLENYDTLFSYEYFDDFLDMWLAYSKEQGHYEAERVGPDLDYYDIELDGYHFVFLAVPNEGYYEIDDAQLAWVEKILFENEESGKPIFVMCHVPLEHKVAHKSDTRRGGYVGDSDLLLEAILAEHPNAIYISGDTHYTVDSETQNTVNGMQETPSYVNDGAVVDDVWKAADEFDSASDWSKQPGDLSQGLIAEIYSDRIVFKGRYFMTGQWISQGISEVTFKETCPIDSFRLEKTVGADGQITLRASNAAISGLTYAWYLDGEKQNATASTLIVPADFAGYVAVRAIDENGNYRSELYDSLSEISTYVDDADATVGDTAYPDISDAVEDAVAQGEVIVLEKNSSIYLAPYEKVVINKNGYALAVNTKEGWKTVVLENTDGTVTAASYKDFGEVFDTFRLELDGSINMTFFLKNIDVLLNNSEAYVEVTVPTRDGEGRILKYYADDLIPDEKGRYMLTVTSIAAAQQTDKVAFQIVNGEERGRLRHFSVRDYADKAIDPAYNCTETTVALVKSILNYGAMAQELFKYNQENLANNGLYDGNTNPVNAITAEMVTNDDLSFAAENKTGVDLADCTVDANLQSSTSLKFFFAASGDCEYHSVADMPFQVKRGSTVIEGVSPKAVMSGDTVIGWEIIVKNISACDYEKVYTVSICPSSEVELDESEWATISGSVLGYSKYLIESSTASAAQKNIARALYNYYVDMMAYLGSPVVDESGCQHGETYIEIVKAATCTSAGEKVEKCALCGATIANTSVAIDAKNHDTVLREAVAATCQAQGFAAHYECKLCGKLFSAADGVTEVTMATLATAATGHDESVNGLWNSEKNCYMSIDACASCGKTYPVMGNVNMMPGVLAATTNPTACTVTESADGKYATYLTTGNSFFIPYTGGTAVSGQYMVIKYRSSSWANKSFSIYTSATTDSAIGADYFGYSATVDGDWHYIIADLSANHGNFIAEDDVYTMNFFRIGGLKNSGESVDFAYIVFGDDLANLVSSLKTFDVDARELAIEVCEHPAASLKDFRYFDSANHSATCGICGMSGVKAAHVASAYQAVKSGDKYYAACTVCKGATAEERVFNLVFTASDRLASANRYGGTRTQTTEGDITYITHEATGEWYGGAGYAMLNNISDGYVVSGLNAGKYLVVKVRNNQTTEGYFTVGIVTEAGGGKEIADLKAPVPVPASSGWRVVVVDLSQYLGDKYPANADGETYAIKSMRLFTKLGSTLDYEYVGFTDSLEVARQQAGDACIHYSAWCSNYATAGDAGHSFDCALCQKSITEAHVNTTINGVYDETVGAYVTYCKLCGEHSTTVVPANVIIAGNDLISGAKSSHLTVSLTDGVAKYLNNDGGDAYITGFSTNTLVTGNYFFIKARPSNDTVTLQIFTSTEKGTASGSGDVTARQSLTAGEWNYYIVDVSTLSTFNKAEDGNYYAKHIRLDIDGATDDYIEVEYFGFADDLEHLFAGIKAYDDSENSDCNHPEIAVSEGICAICGEDPAKDDLKLSFDANGDYKIAIFSDMRLSATVDQTIIDDMLRVVDEAQPDLVLFGGDMHNGSVDSESELRAILDAINTPLAERGIYWCHTFGVDSEGKGGSTTGFSREEQLAIYQTYSHCITPNGAEGVYGVSNYVLPIYNAEGKAGFNLWCLDSNGYLDDRQAGFSDKVFIGPNNLGGGTQLDTMYYSQILWYWNRSLEFQSANGGVNVPSIMYFQVPALQFMYLVQNPSALGTTGTMTTPLTASERESGIIWTCFERGDIKGIFCGYDSQNDYAGTYLGMTLAGCASVGAESDKYTAGARVITLSDFGANYSQKMVYAYEEGGQNSLALNWQYDYNATANAAGATGYYTSAEAIFDSAEGYGYARIYPNTEKANATTGSYDTYFNALTNGTAPVGQYLVIKYRSDAVGNVMQVFTSTTNAGAVGADCFTMKADNGLFIADGRWHLTVVDLSKAIGSYDPDATSGEYIAKYLRFDPLNFNINEVSVNESNYLDISYIGIASDLDRILAYDHKVVSIQYYDGTLTEYDACTHTGAKYANWDESLGYYVTETACTRCGKTYRADYTYIFDNDHNSNITAKQGHDVTFYDMGGVSYMTLKKVSGKNAWISMSTGSWCSVSSVPSSTAYIPAQYAIIKYRAPEATDGETIELRYSSYEGANALTAAGKSNSVYYEFTVVGDNEWHYVVVDMVAYNETAWLPTTGGERIFWYFGLDITGISAGNSFDLAFIGTATDLDYMREVINADEKATCDHAHRDADGGCYGCGDGAACSHSFGSTATWDATVGSYVVSCTKGCGEVKAVMGNLVLDAQTIANGTVHSTATLEYIEDATYGAFARHTKTGGGTRFSPYTATALNTVETGNFIIIKYKTDMYEPASGKTPCIGFDTATVVNDYLGTGNAYNGAYRDYYYGLVEDGEWHYLIVDLSKHKSGFTAHTDGKYYMGYLAIGGYDGAANASRIDFAYIVTGNDLAHLTASVAKADSDFATVMGSECDHSFTDGSEICLVCGYNPNVCEHVWDTATAWNETAGSYAVSCTKGCGEVKTVAGLLVLTPADIVANMASDALTTFAKTYSNMPVTSNMSVTSENNGEFIRFERTGGGSCAYIWADAEGDFETGRYLIMKYKSDVYEHATPTCGVFVSTTTVTSGSINGVGVDGVYHSITENDTATAGNWHYLIVDLTEGRTTVVEDGGKYTIDYVRISGFDGNGSQVDIAYMAFGDDIDNLVSSVSKYDESFGEIVADECACPAFAAGSIEYVDETVHGATCTICGTVDEVAHSGARYANWSETLGYYITETACEVCGETYKMDYTYMFDSYHHRNVTNFNGYPHTKGDEYTTFTGNGANTWVSMSTGNFCKSPYFDMPAHYAVIKYRAPAATNGDYVTLRFGSKGSSAATTYDVSIVGDGEWHYAVVNLSVVDTAKFYENANGEHSLDWFGFFMGGLASGHTLDVAYIGTASNLEYLQELVTADAEITCTHAHTDGSNVCYGCGATITAG